jgi:hypothetical protein
MIAAQQIGMTLRDAPTSEQAKSDHEGSFLGGSVLEGRSRTRRGTELDKPFLYSQKRL